MFALGLEGQVLDMNTVVQILDQSLMLEIALIGTGLYAMQVVLMMGVICFS